MCLFCLEKTKKNLSFFSLKKKVNFIQTKFKNIFKIRESLKFHCEIIVGLFIYLMNQL